MCFSSIQARREVLLTSTASRGTQAKRRPGNGASLRQSVTVAGQLPPVHVGANHEEAEPQEGKVGHQGTNHDPVTMTNFRAARSLEDEQ